MKEKVLYVYIKKKRGERGGDVVELERLNVLLPLPLKPLLLHRDLRKGGNDLTMLAGAIKKVFTIHLS